MKLNTFCILLIALTFIGCANSVGEKFQDAKDIIDDADSPNEPTAKEIEAVKQPCDDVASDAIEKCNQAVLDNINEELTKTFNKRLQKFEKFAANDKNKVSDDKTVAKRFAENLQNAQKTWLAYREANCIAESENDWNESNRNLTKINCLQRVTEQRIDELNLIYDNK
ncbi:MAG: DUF1311 domain-containing protein [Pyrinomonadaceae bacterium]|nr:DUF1311 domain-containing protein [Pyrinomonadaceae bacterium]